MFPYVFQDTGSCMFVRRASLSVFDHHALEGGGLKVKPVNLSIEEQIIGGDVVPFATPLGTQADTLIPQAERSFQHQANIRSVSGSPR